MITDQEFSEIAHFGRITVVEENLSAALLIDEPNPLRTWTHFYILFTAANSAGEPMIFGQDQIHRAWNTQIRLIHYVTGRPFADDAFTTAEIRNKGLVTVIQVTQWRFFGIAPIAVSFQPRPHEPPISTDLMSFSGFDSRAIIRATRQFG